MIRSLSSFFRRDFIASVFILATTSLREQYRNTFMGSLWAVIQPAMYITILSVVFTHIMRFNIPDYTLYLVSGILPWNFMLTCFTIGGNALIGREGVIKRATISKTMFVLADVTSQLYTFFISLLTILFVVFVFIAHNIHWTVLLLPVALLPVFLTAFAGAMFMAYVGAYLRDLPLVVGIVMQALFWTVPIVYQIDFIPETYRAYYALNPFYLLIHPVQQVLYYGQVPAMADIADALLVAVAALGVSAFVCSRLRRNVVYYL